MGALEHNTQTPVQQDHSDEIDLTDLLNVIIQGWKWIVGIFIVVVGLGVSYAILTPPIYEADALIQVEDQQGAGGGLAGLQMLSEGLGLQQSVVADELEILRSREVLMKAIDATKATVSIEVDNRFPLIGGWWARRHEAQEEGTIAEPLWGLGGFAWGGEQLDLAEIQLPRRALGKTFYLEITDDGYEFQNEDGDVLLSDQAIGERLSFEVNGQEAFLAVERIQGRPGTRFAIEQRSPVITYESMRQKLNVAQAGGSGQQSQVIRVKYEGTDKQFARDFVDAVAKVYLEQNVQRRSAEARQSLAFLEEQLPELKHNVEQKEEELSAFRSSSGTISIPDETRGLLDQSIDLENRRLELEMKRDEMQQRYTGNHPMLRALNQQLGQLQRASDELGGMIDSLPQSQRDLLRLERDAQVNTQLYIALLNNAQELRLAEAGTVGNVRIIDFAVLAERPIKPKKLLIVAVSAMLGLMLGVFVVLVRSFLRPAIQTADTLEQRTGLTTYASLPVSESQSGLFAALSRRRQERRLLVYSNPDDPVVESLRSLRTGLAFAMMGTQGKTLTITGATAGVGKSFVAANLGALLAIDDKKVVIIDADLRRARLGEYFGYDRKRPGLSDVLLGKVDLSEVLFKINDGLFVLPAGTTPPNPGELLLSAGFGQLIQQLEQDYDQVVVDTPPILPVADTLAIMKHTSAAFMVVRAEQSTAREVQDAMTRLRTAGVDAPLKGTIFNGVRRFRLGYGASYSYYYSYK